MSTPQPRSAPPQRVRRVALTGGIATGKSHVRRQFADLGVPTIDADRLARDALATGTAGLDAVVRRFGTGLLDPSGALNRARLATLVFADAEARLALEAIVHPFVRQATDDWFASLDPRTHGWALADIPLLYEVGRDRDFDAVIVAACAPDTQLRRIVRRDHLTEEEARQRMAAQLPIDEKTRRADFVIWTDGTFPETNAAVQEVFERLNSPVPTGS